MVVSSIEHGIQADVVFVIESTATNGAYLNDFRTNYIVPTLEYFSQVGIDDREFSDNGSSLYGIVTYNAIDCLPSPFTGAYGPFSQPVKLLMTLEKLEMIGGKGESHANIAEGLATALESFQDLQMRREPNIASQKHCILICNSPPYQTVVQESCPYFGYTLEQLANLFQEKNISLSILSPRKIPALYKLFEKAGGDLQSSQAKNYAKDPRHLVLLRNYNLKERPVSPTSAVSVAAATTGPPNVTQIPLSPLQSNDSPNTNQAPQNIITQPPQAQNPAFRNATPQNITVHQNVPNMTGPMAGARPGFNPQINAPPNYHPGTMGARAPHPRGWMRSPYMGQGVPTPAAQTGQSSALIAQLSQPPSTMGLNVQSFTQRMEGTNTMGQNAQQQAQMNQHQQQLRLNMQMQQNVQQQQQNVQQQQNPQQGTLGLQGQTPANMQGSQLNVGVNQSMAPQVPQAAAVSQANVPPQVPTGQAQANQMQVPINPMQSQVTGGPLLGSDRTIIWKGTLEWTEKTKAANDAQKQTWQVPCQVSSTIKDGEQEVKAESWPSKLLMQLMPKVLLGSFGQAYLKNSKSVIFYPTNCDALESLIKVMSTGFAGCVHFTSLPGCNIKVLLLLYTAEKRSFIGFIPNEQTAFVDRLRKVIQQQKASQSMIRQGPGPVPGLRNPGPNTVQPGNPNAMPAGIPNTGISQSGILMSQTNTMTMGGGQITQNVIPPNGPQQNLTGQQGQINIQNVGMTSGATGQQGQMNQAQGNMMNQRQLSMEMARQQNLFQIQQLQKNLEAAQQKEAHFQSLDLGNIQQTLEQAQQQEMQYKQLEAQQAQRNQMNQASAMQAPQQPNAQRMMRPVMTNNLGLRNLLQQQQQPQYRQVLGMQQQMVGPRGQMPPRQMAPGNQQNQQFDEVSNYDFLG